MKKSRAYYQYMLDLADKKVSYYSSDDISQIVYDLLDEGEVNEAMEACQKGLTQHPGDETLELIEAKVLLHQREYDKAQRLLRANPECDSPFGYSIQFGIDIAQQNFDDAFEHVYLKLETGKLLPLEYVEIIDEFFDRLPHDVTAEYLLKAYHLLSESRRSDAQSAEVYGRIGAMLMDCHNHSAAIPVLETAIDHDAYDVYSWQDLARCQFELQRYEDCINSSEMGLAIDPENPLFNFVLGVIKAHEGHHQEAIKYLEVVRQYTEGKIKHETIYQERSEAEQQTCIAYEILGKCYGQIDQTAKSIECFKTLVGRAPDVADYHFLLATAYVELGNKAEGLKSINKALHITPDNDVYLSFELTLLSDLHKFDEAMRVLDHLIELRPESQNYLLAKAELSLSLRRYEEADVAYRKLLNLKPKDPTTLSMMRAYFESIGDDEALKTINTKRR